MSVASVHIADVGLPRSLALLRRPRPDSVPGLIRADTGLAATFGTTPARPSPGRVGLIAFWNDSDDLDRFDAGHPLASSLRDGLAIRARPLRVHGAWPGIGDDVSRKRVVDHDGPVLVLTLARTRFSRTLPFFRASQPAEKAVRGAPGNVFATAVLRPPFIASVSLWESSEAAIGYAYSGNLPGHPEAIAAGRDKPFHHQQAFVRLAIDEIRGSLGGRNPLAAGAVQLGD